jgi:zinc transporter 7
MLNIAGDAMHNFTDGLAIGASFATYTLTHSSNQVTFASLMASQGGLATISILFHEIPHELGDYCVLLKGGFTKRQAILTQFMTAIAAMVGSLVGLWAVEGWGSHSMVYLTAGGFVYLAAVTILPQVLDESSSSFQTRLVQLVAFLTGIAFMYGVLMLEEHDHSGPWGHSHGHEHAKEVSHHAHETHSHHDHDAASHHHEHAAHHHHDHEL